jgi:hypothetical protein
METHNIYRNVRFSDIIDIYTIDDDFIYSDSDLDSDSKSYSILSNYKSKDNQPKIIKNDKNNSYVFKGNFIKTKYFWWRF